LKACIEEFPSDIRVAVVGSGGLSHMVVEEDLDWLIIRALLEKDAHALQRLPIPALKSGSSEILCWVAAAGAFHSLENRWLEYIPVRRTAAGTGIGLAFGTWS
jgi:OH-DDVA oxygenase